MIDLLKSTEAPKKIYGWINTQMSIARYYGGLTYQGYFYAIDMNDPDKPLVRQDVLDNEKKEMKSKIKATKEAIKNKKQPVNLDLF